jgi:ribosomal protein L11 methyltransferase
MGDWEGDAGVPAVLRVGRRWRIVRPDGAGGARGDALDLVVPRGAFGSGEHETTASCLVELERLAPIAGLRVLDVGCGTGILAIAALRLGAVRAVGVDIDGKAAATARRAARLNRLADRFDVVLGSLQALAPAPHDLVLANLHGDVLLDIAGPIVSRAEPGGIVLLSGIAWEWAYQVRQEYVGRGCAVVKERWLEEYVTLSMTAPEHKAGPGRAAGS